MIDERTVVSVAAVFGLVLMSGALWIALRWSD